jgi:hypothetical protein
MVNSARSAGDAEISLLLSAKAGSGVNTIEAIDRAGGERS